MLNTTLLRRSLVSGTLAAAATSLVAACLGRREAGSHAAPLNATSHVAWGDRAALHNRASLKYTGLGFALNYGACVFWALLYEGLADTSRPDSLTRPSRSRRRAARDAAITSAVAYVTDYQLVPRRLTPGFELRLPGRALALVYVALGLGLCARDLLARPRAPARPEPVGATPRTPETMYGFAAGNQDVMKLAAGDEGGASRDPRRKKREVPDLTGKAAS